MSDTYLKRCEIVALEATGYRNYCEIGKCFITNKWVYNSNLPFADYHLYILSDDEVTAGFWVLNTELDNTLIKSTAITNKGTSWQKVIATTDEKLIQDGVAKIPDSFLKEFCEANGMNVVEIEYQHQHIYNTFPVIEKEGISVQKLHFKENYTDKEVIKLLSDLRHEILSKEFCKECDHIHFSTLDFRKWLDLNLNK